MQKFVSYLRVSTDRQGASGLGLEAQRAAVMQHIGSGELVAEFLEVESGRKDDRPQLQRALIEAKRKGAVLVVAKLDRLARDAHFLLGLMKAGVDFVAADNPQANRLTVGILALVAEEEARAISARTKAALQAAKARGVALGSHNPAIREALEGGQAQSIATRKAAADAHAAALAGRFDAMQREGLSLRHMAERLNSEGVATARGGQWHAATVRNAIQRHICGA